MTSFSGTYQGNILDDLTIHRTAWKLRSYAIYGCVFAKHVFSLSQGCRTGLPCCRVGCRCRGRTSRCRGRCRLRGKTSRCRGRTSRCRGKCGCRGGCRGRCKTSRCRSSLARHWITRHTLQKQSSSSNLMAWTMSKGGTEYVKVQQQGSKLASRNFEGIATNDC